MASDQVLLGARIPANLKSRLMKFCIDNGIKMNYFVTKAIKEQLIEMIEDAQDVQAANKILKNDEFVSQDEFDKHITKLGIKP